MRKKKKIIPSEVPFDCPDCGAQICFVKNIAICEKCGAEFKKRFQIKPRPFEYFNPVDYAKAHIAAAKLLLDSDPTTVTLEDLIK